MLGLIGTVLAASVALSAAGAAPASRQEAAARNVLQSCAGFGDDEARKLQDGNPASRTLPARDRHEIAVAGAIRIDIPAQFFVEQLRDIESFKRSALVRQIGRFARRPSLADLASLQLDADDLADLRHCRVGDCDVKLPAAAIERFRLELDWSKPGVRGQAEDLARRMLLENTLAYLDGGDAALADYADKRTSVNRARELRLLLSGWDCAGVPAETRAYLARFPSVSSSEDDSFLYWSKEAFGLKPLLSVTHVAIFPPAPGRPALIVSKGIYSSHYVDASMSLTWLLDDDSGEEPAIDVVYINRSRVDTFGGPFGRLARSVASSRQRDGMQRELTALKTRLEAAWRTRH